MKGRRLSHVDERGAARMVDVGAKPDMIRSATAAGEIVMRPATIRLLKDAALPKGDVLATARIAGIQAAKRTSEWIPLCHPLPLHAVEVAFAMRRDRVKIEATARCTGKTGVEMEALTAVAAAGLTLYDMCKAVDDGMVLGDIRLLSKTKRMLPPS